MTDPYPPWPPDWLDEHHLASEETLAQAGEVELTSGLRSDGRVLMAVAWPGGRRYMLIDPIGTTPPQALRVGERSEDAETARLVEGVWSQALKIAKGIIDGELELPVSGGERPGRRRWRRGFG